MPTAAIKVPAVARGRGPILGSSWLVNPAARMMPTENGMNKRPVFTAEYCSMSWK